MGRCGRSGDYDRIWSEAPRRALLAPSAIIPSAFEPFGREDAMDTEREGTKPASDWAPEGRISFFPVPDEKELDPRVAEIVAKQREKLGEPNNVVRTHAWRPELMLRWLEFYEFISKGPSGLSRVDREMIGVVVSAENRCLF
jgi:hypothetical protein